MRALDRKLLRDLWQLRGQGLTIALVVACGIASYVALASTYRSLEGGRDRYYEANRFADVFVHLKRAPNDVARRIEAVPGVASLEVREVEDVILPMPALLEPAVGRIVTLPGARAPSLDVPHLRRGRMVEPGRADEVVVLESFALAHALDPGDSVPAVIDGVRRELRVVGVALSPEYIFAVAGFEPVPDPARFAVLWMDRDVVAPAFQMEGAFNDVQIRLQPGASEASVIEGVDRVLAPYGGLGAYGRARQVSHRFLEGELQQLGQLATVTAAIFLGVAAFLLHVVLARLVHMQRAQIATLRAIGYRGGEIGAHYLALVSVIVLLGAGLGVGLGVVLGRGMMGLYEPYFRYPAYAYRLDASIVAVSVLVSSGAALAGAVTTLARAARLPPAEAMRPDTPPSYRASLLERAGLGRLLDPSGRMVLRELSRRPVRTWLSSLGIALGVAILISARFSYDALDAMIELELETAQRDDLTVAFLRPLPDSARRAIAHLPGVLATEPGRVVPVRLRAGPRSRDVALIGAPAGATLRRVFAWPRREVTLPERGVVLTDQLAEILGVRPGDALSIEVLEGDRRKRDVPVAGLVSELFGLQAHMSLAALHRLLGEEDVISSVALRLDPRAVVDVTRRLEDMPVVASVTRRAAVIARFEEQTAATMNITTLVLVLFAGTIAVGVVYNNARIALSMRSRDLASMRVLGFTRAEISTVLLGELAAYVLLAIPLGLAIGTWLAHAVASMIDVETFRFPVVISARTYAFAVAVTLGAALLSALLVRRQLDRLDLVAVLKTRE